MATVPPHDLPTKPISTLSGPPTAIHALTYSASPGTYILTGSADRIIRLYNPFPATTNNSHTVQPGKLIQTYSAHGYEVLDVKVSSDNARFVSCGGDRTVFLWDVATAKTIRRLGGNSGHTARINSVCFGGADDSVIISGSFDASVRMWDTKSQSHKPIQVFTEARDSVSVVMLNGGGVGAYEVVTGSVDGRVRYYDIRMGKLETDVLGAPVTSLTSTRDGQGILVGTLDGTVRMMDRKGGGCLKSYKGHTNSEYRIRSCFGSRDRYVVSGSEGEAGETKGESGGYGKGEVCIWDSMTGTVMARIVVPGRNGEGLKRIIGSDGREKTRRNVISCVAWKDSGKGNQWCCAGTDGVVTVYGS